MAEANELRDPWLVAVWPGMGNVALLAGSYLLQQIHAQRVHEIESPELFEIDSVEVRNGVATAGRLPRNLLLEWKNPEDGRDLVVFVGEAQPNTGGYGLCEKIMEYAATRGVRKFFTFAAMATQLHPGNTPRVFAAATDGDTLGDLKGLDVEVLKGGQISGLNGVLLAAGSERGMSGTCLLGELPYFAVGVPNPRAAQAVLERFTALAGVEIDFSGLEEQAQTVDQELLQLLEKIQSGESDDDDDDDESTSDLTQQSSTDTKGAQEPQIEPRVRRKIEGLFDRAGRDRSKAVELKKELDRLGVFRQYEDRFLDLFRQAE
jgi:hypothetical protein